MTKTRELLAKNPVRWSITSTRMVSIPRMRWSSAAAGRVVRGRKGRAVDDAAVVTELALGVRIGTSSDRIGPKSGRPNDRADLAARRSSCNRDESAPGSEPVVLGRPPCWTAGPARSAEPIVEDAEQPVHLAVRERADVAQTPRTARADADGAQRPSPPPIEDRAFRSSVESLGCRQAAGTAAAAPGQIVELVIPLSICPTRSSTTGRRGRDTSAANGRASTESVTGRPID